MKEVINLAGPTAKIVDSPIPEPNDDQVLIKVVVSGSNPKDWKCPDLAADPNSPILQLYPRLSEGVNQGDDIAGIVEKVGKNPGDRVGAFHEMIAVGGSYAEYAIAYSHTTFHLPKEISFEEAATIPLAGLTAVIALYHHLALPFPWKPAEEAIPCVIYGGSTAVGAFAIKLLRRSNVHPIIAVAGNGASYIEPLLDRSKGDTIVDYRNGSEQTIQGIRDALRGKGLKHVLDTIVQDQTTQILKSVLAPGGNVNAVLGGERDVSPGVATNTWVSSAHEAAGGNDCRELAYIFSRWFSRELQLGLQGEALAFSGHPYEVRPGGLHGVRDALQDLKDNKASAVKYVFRIADTPGLT
ncbi:zinc-binding alcohol dehydrogenase family protein [Aspergillus affinis]|uniref:zinc-binding alcohol dehydrogenase family protein n=1 Tax=Aspergillus affinis TaxID=1070780 RepID=UPI0022FEB087|nr:quinone oxidoreductase [Aspergillus affinis]KAI9041115.1 quinone oxidoreductase [Aspergillus affinis]